MHLWAKFRDRASRKEERSHFGLAWSVLAAYWLAGAILLRSLRGSGWIVSLADAGVVVFFVFGAFGVYLAFAVPMRWWPHHPKKRDDKSFYAVGEIFLNGYIRLEQWGRLTAESKQPLTNNSDAQLRQQSLALAIGRANELVEWIPASEEQIKALLGEDEFWRYKFSENLLEAAPAWAQEGQFPMLWQQVQGRLCWIKTWMDKQLDL